jgi:hypothetical protein
VWKLSLGRPICKSLLRSLEGVWLRKPLTPREIIELDQALIEVFSLHRALKSRVPTARYIKFPQIPAILAESFIIITASKLFGADWKARFGGSVSDVQLSNAIGQMRRVEVKSTASHEFQKLKSKDLLADTLVWVRFGKRFYEGYGTIQIVILDNPGAHILEPVRLDIPRLMRRVGNTPDLRHIEIANFEEFLLSP